ncbi:MAG: porin, partial [Proteobacteria bacterium]|nr:porin [Pseudomonadota bacterium]
MGFKKIVFALPLAALLSLPVIARAEEPDPAALQGKVDSLDERTSGEESDVSGLKKIKLTGNIQARYE